MGLGAAYSCSCDAVSDLVSQMHKCCVKMLITGDWPGFAWQCCARDWSRHCREDIYSAAGGWLEEVTGDARGDDGVERGLVPVWPHCPQYWSHHLTIIPDWPYNQPQYSTTLHCIPATDLVWQLRMAWFVFKPGRATPWSETKHKINLYWKKNVLSSIQ